MTHDVPCRPHEPYRWNHIPYTTITLLRSKDHDNKPLLDSCHVRPSKALNVARVLVSSKRFSEILWGTPPPPIDEGVPLSTMQSARPGDEGPGSQKLKQVLNKKLRNFLVSSFNSILFETSLRNRPPRIFQGKAHELP